MRWFLSAVLYTALALGANTAFAEPADIAALREGSMLKLVVHDAPLPVSETTFTDEAGAERRLADWRGKVVLVNFWATWCAPCRKELPALEALGREFAGEGFEVLTIATGRNPVPAIRRLFDDVGVTDLPILLDPKQALAREMAVLGLPVTVILNPDGQEIARLSGDAEWDGASARAIVTALTAQP